MKILCAGDGGFDLGSGADDALVLHEAFDVGLGELRNFRWVEVFEGSAKAFATLENDAPGEAGLKAFQHEHLPEHAGVVLGDTPLSVVVLLHEGVAVGPEAAGLRVGCGHDVN